MDWICMSSSFYLLFCSFNYMSGQFKELPFHLYDMNYKLPKFLICGDSNIIEGA